MGIKYIHVVLIVLSILLCICFGLWTLNHNYEMIGYGSFLIAIALSVYCVLFIKKMKAL